MVGSELLVGIAAAVSVGNKDSIVEAPVIVDLRPIDVGIVAFRLNVGVVIDMSERCWLFATLAVVDFLAFTTRISHNEP